MAPDDFGIKVVREGADVNTSDIRDILMSSKFSMLKFHSDQTSSVTVNGGDTEKYVDFTHSLGYVPAFIAYYKYGNNIYFIPNVPRSGGFDNYGYAFSDSSKVRCGIVFPNGYNQLVRSTFNSAYSDPLGTPYPGGGHFPSGSEKTGGWTYSDLGTSVGDAIQIPQGMSVANAYLDFYISEKGAASGDVKIITYGIDVDDVGAFGSDMGQARTTASTAQNVAAPLGSTFAITVTDQVQEIVNRAGWSNGNNMGFYMFDNGSSNDQYVSTFSDGILGLNIVKSGSTDVYFRCIIFKDKISA